MHELFQIFYRKHWTCYGNKEKKQAGVYLCQAQKKQRIVLLSLAGIKVISVRFDQNSWNLTRTEPWMSLRSEYRVLNIASLVYIYIQFIFLPRLTN